MVGRELVEQGDVAVQIFGGPEDQSHDRAGGVVDGSEECHRGTAGLQPGKLTAIEQHEGAHAPRGGPAAAVLAGAPPMLGRQPEGPADPPHRGPTD
jgi:hypothetical protein